MLQHNRICEIPEGVAVDTGGIVYVSDSGHNQVVKSIPPSSSGALPFKDLKHPLGLAVDTGGDVYVADYEGDRVVKLTPGSRDQSVLPFADLKGPTGVAVDARGDVY